MSADALYGILRPETTTAIPLVKAASYFVRVKLASGGLLPAEVELMKMAFDPSVSDEDIRKAVTQGQLGGIRSSVSQDILAASKLRRSKGERTGKELGTAAGALAGLLAGGKGRTVGERALHAGVGAVAGRSLGKLVGEKADTARVAKGAAMDKVGKINLRALLHLGGGLSEAVDADQLRDAAISGGVTGGSEQALSDTLSTGGAMAGSALPGRFKYPGIVAGNLAGKGLAAQMAHKRDVLAKEAQLDSPTGVEADEQMSDGYPASTHDMSGDAAPAEPVVNPDQDLQPHPLNELLDLIQRGNESDHFRQRAEAAESEVGSAQEQAQMLQEQLEQMSQQHDMEQQQNMQQMETANMQAQSAQAQMQEAQMQSAQAQQQNTQLIQSMNAFRQALIDLVAQDPVAAATPGLMAPSPQGGMISPDMSGQQQDPSQAAPQQQGGQQLSQEQAPPEQAQGGSDGGGEGGGEGSGSSVQVKVSPEKPKAPKPPKAPESQSA